MISPTTKIRRVPVGHHVLKLQIWVCCPRFAFHYFEPLISSHLAGHRRNGSVPYDTPRVLSWSARSALCSVFTLTPIVSHSSVFSIHFLSQTCASFPTSTLFPFPCIPVCLLLLDLSDATALTNLDPWYSQFQEGIAAAALLAKPMCIVVGCKNDLPRQVSDEALRASATLLRHLFAPPSLLSPSTPLSTPPSLSLLPPSPLLGHVSPASCDSVCSFLLNSPLCLVSGGQASMIATSL